MKSVTRFSVISALVCMGCAIPARASLIGTAVTGNLKFLGNPLNYFDPANGFVPATGYENSSGTTVTIAEPAIEYGAVFPANTDTANFTPTQLIMTDVVNSAGTNIPFTMTFTDAAFSGLSVSTVSDTFANGGTTVSLIGNTLTVAWNGGLVDAGSLQALYNLTPSTAVPEPASWALLLIGMAIAIRRVK